mmetsp:Transcript_3321/g.7562  ORF Transcript_3321/g.7562 Transcript_3321/m.7562 type:complete len:255 (+) Transcript_3321:1138-1902(+)
MMGLSRTSSSSRALRWRGVDLLRRHVWCTVCHSHTSHRTHTISSRFVLHSFRHQRHSGFFTTAGALNSFSSSCSSSSSGWGSSTSGGCQLSAAGRLTPSPPVSFPRPRTAGRPRPCDTGPELQPGPAAGFFFFLTPSPSAFSGLSARPASPRGRNVFWAASTSSGTAPCDNHSRVFPPLPRNPSFLSSFLSAKPPASCPSSFLAPACSSSAPSPSSSGAPGSSSSSPSSSSASSCWSPNECSRTPSAARASRAR